MYKNILVIYDLYCPEIQIPDFVNTIVAMAERVTTWERIVYLSPSDLNAVANLMSNGDFSDYTTEVHKVLGIQEAAELFVSTDVHPSNLMMIKAYPAARKVCFGDGLGIYIPATYQYLTRSDKTETSSKGLLSKLTTLFLSRFSRSKLLDIGYFAFPQIYGQKPPMQYKKIPTAVIKDTLSRMSTVLDTPEVGEVLTRLSGNDIAVLMTSNFSEAQRMTLEDEIASYREFILSMPDITRRVLIIKPHPRDDLVKIKLLQESLENEFPYVFTMHEGLLPYIPFESFLLKLLPRVSSDVAVYTFSTSFISLKLLFNIETHIGYGKHFVTKYFYEHCREQRIQHELDLKKVFETINPVIP